MLLCHLLPGGRLPGSLLRIPAGPPGLELDRLGSGRLAAVNLLGQRDLLTQGLHTCIVRPRAERRNRKLAERRHTDLRELPKRAAGQLVTMDRAMRSQCSKFSALAALLLAFTVLALATTGAGAATPKPPKVPKLGTTASFKYLSFPTKTAKIAHTDLFAFRIACSKHAGRACHGMISYTYAGTMFCRTYFSFTPGNGGNAEVVVSKDVLTKMRAHAKGAKATVPITAKVTGAHVRSRSLRFRLWPR